MNILVGGDFIFVSFFFISQWKNSFDVTLFSDSFDTFYYRLFSSSVFWYSCFYFSFFFVTAFPFSFRFIFSYSGASVFIAISHSFFFFFFFCRRLVLLCTNFTTLFRVNHTNTFARTTLYSHANNALEWFAILEIGQQKKRLLWRF